MRQASRSSLSRAILLILLFVFLFNIPTRSQAINDCSDIKIIFARGSSDNPSSLFLGQPYSNDFKNLEAISGSFFQSFKRLLDRDYPSVSYDSVSVHNFPDLYNNDGYRALGIFGPKTINNIFEAEVSWWPAGEYRESVKGGVEEVVGYVKDRIKDCPNEIIVLGGYSQGANVIGDSLFEFTDEEQEHIHAVALFGDPKYIGSNATQSTPIDYLSNIGNKPIAKPWKRGTASLVDRGYLDARTPYLPVGLENRTLSWCFNDDFVCTGGTGVLKSMRPLFSQQDNNLNKDDLGAGHKRYVNHGAPEAAEEIVQRLSPKLSNLEASRGGKNVLKSFSENTPVSPSDMPIDVMFMINTSYGVDDVLGRLRSDTITLLPPYLAFYNNVNYGIGEYSEAGETTNRIPRVSIRQQPTLNFDTLDRVISRNLSYGGLSGGGLDLEDPHQLGIERAIRATNWRDGAEKHVVIISERPLLSSITYNMCNSSVRTNFGIVESVNCLVDPSRDVGSSFSHPERCKYVYEILISDTCSLQMSPGSTYNVQRSESSLIELLEASDIVVSFVVPHGFKSGTNVESSRSKLKSLASVSGGLYLEYSEFNRASYSDVVWKVLNNRPTRIKLKNIQDFNSANSVYSESKYNSSLQLFTNSIQLFTVTSSKYYDTYSWDINGDGIVDETTDAPQLELKYTSALENKYLTVMASTGDQSSTVRVPINVVDAGPSTELSFPNSPNVKAQEYSDGSVKVEWTCELGGVLFIDLDRDGAVDYSAPCSVSEKSFNDGTGEHLNTWTENYSGKSEIVTVLVDRYIPSVDSGSGGEASSGEDVEVDDSSSNSGDVLEDKATDQNIDRANEEDYSINLSDITKEVVRMLQQTQVEQGGNNTNTYNPQKTQAIDQGAAKNGQQAAAFNQETLSSEFDTTPQISVYSSADALEYIAVLVVLPILILYYRIYIRFKKLSSNTL